VIAIPKASNLDKVRENAAAASTRLTAADLATINAAYPTAHKETAFADDVARSRRVSDSSGRFQSRQIDFPLLARKRDLSSDAALVLLHAGDAMVPGIIHLDFAVAGIDREALLIAKKCVARFVLTAG